MDESVMGAKVVAIVKGAAPMLPLIDLSRFADRSPPGRKWHWDGWLPAGQAAYLGGGGGSGKSLLGQQMATCSAAGLPFLGVPMRPAVTLYITCEDDPDELERRHDDICSRLGVSKADMIGKLHLVSLFGLPGNELATFDPAGLMVTTGRWAEILATVRHLKPGLIVLDNVAHFFAGNEIVRNQVAAFCGLLNSLAMEGGASVLLIGHPAKEKGSEYSGSTAWENQFRARLFLETPKDDGGAIIDADLRVLKRSKSNYARTGETIEFRWHKWAFVCPDDLPPDDRAEVAANVQAAAENATFLACLAKATEEKRATSTSRSASNYAPRLFAAMPTGKRIPLKGHEAAMQRLLHLGKILNGQKVYQRDNRSWVTGLGLAPTLAPTMHQPAHQPCTDLHSDQERDDRTNLHALTLLDTTYQTGAAIGVGAPVEEDEDAAATARAAAWNGAFSPSRVLP